MAEILLLDFSKEEWQSLKEKKFDVELKETNWKSGKTESLIPPKDCKIVFYKVKSQSSASGACSGNCCY